MPKRNESGSTVIYTIGLAAIAAILFAILVPILAKAVVSRRRHHVGNMRGASSYTIVDGDTDIVISELAMQKIDGDSVQITGTYLASSPSRQAHDRLRFRLYDRSGNPVGETNVGLDLSDSYGSFCETSFVRYATFADKDRSDAYSYVVDGLDTRERGLSQLDHSNEVHHGLMDPARRIAA